MISFSFKFTFLLIVSLFSSVTLAAVWSSEKQWDEKMEMDYSRWIKEDLSANVFTDPASAYYGIKTDCADAVLVVRAIYSFENKLPFSFYNVDGVVLNNQTKKYDHIEQERRIISFLNDLGDQISAESLALENTFSIHPKDIRPGDFYIVKWENNEGKTNRHAYLIKDILPTGNFILLSSTTPKTKRVLATRLGMPVQLFSSSPFGFRRFKERASKVLINDDLTQYAWVKLGEKEFYTRVKDLLKTEEDTYQKNFERRFSNICIALDVRKQVVEEAIRLKNGRRCFSSSEYDEYSTPSRDHNLLMEFMRIKNAWLTISNKKIAHDLTTEEVLGLDFFIGKQRGPEGQFALSKRCIVSITKSNGEVMAMNLKVFFERLSNGIVSSNPNDPIEARYGAASSTQNSCH